MIVPLDHDERVARRVLRGDVPRRIAAVAASPDAQAAALADGEEREPGMLADPRPVPGFDGTRSGVDETGEEGREAALADEAQTGAVGLVVRREPRLAGHGPHRVLAQTAEREQRPFESRPVQRVQEIALILGGVGALEQPHRAAAALDPRVVAGRHALGAEPARVVDERGELHLPVAHHVRVRGHPALDAADELREDVVPVRVGAVHRMQRHAEPVAYALRVGEILGRRAVSVAVVLLPVLHEHRLHRDTRLDQAHQRDRGVDAAGDRDHRRSVFLRGRERSVGEGRGGKHRGVGVDRVRAQCNRTAPLATW